MAEFVMSCVNDSGHSLLIIIIMLVVERADRCLLCTVIWWKRDTLGCIFVGVEKSSVRYVDSQVFSSLLSLFYRTIFC